MLTDAILALFLNIFIQELWPIFHNINLKKKFNVCKFQNFHSPVKKKKKKKKKKNQFQKNILSNKNILPYFP